MKKLFLISILMVCIQVAFSQTVAQKIDTIYYDSNWKGVPLKVFANFIRIIYKAPKGTMYSDIVKDFYITGELKAEGDFPIFIDRYDDSKSKWKGRYVRYYKSGKKEAEGFNNDSSKYEGKQYSYYENGQMKMSGTFKNGLPDGELSIFYENGKPNEIKIFSNGILQNSTGYYENGNIKIKGAFTNGKINGTLFQYNEDGSGCIETEMLDGQPKNEFVTWVDVNGNRTKFDKELKNIIRDDPNLTDLKSTLINGQTLLYYEMNGILIAVNMSTINEYGKYFKASIIIGNNQNKSFVFEADKLSGSVKKAGKLNTCKVLSSDEFSSIVGKKQRSSSFWNSFSENLATINAGVTTSSTSNVSTGLGADNSGNVVAAIGSSSSQTKSYNAGSQYQANQVAQQNISQFDNQLERYKQSLDEGYLKSNEILPGKSIVGNVNIKYQNGEKLILIIPIDGIFYPFEWSIGN